MTVAASNKVDQRAAPVSGGMRTAVVVRRIIAATADELFDAWLDPDSLAQWMHPGLITPSTASVDARIGGAFEVVMQHHDGLLRHYGVYRDIKRNQKLVFTWHSDATHHIETLVTVTLHVVTAGTEIVVMHERIPDDGTSSHIQGWTQALALLEGLFPQKASQTISKEIT